MGRKKVFVDTSAWFALQIANDKNYRQARGILPRLFDRYEYLVTSNHVIGETYTLLRTSKGYREAKRFLDILNQSPRLEKIFASEKIENLAYQLLHQYHDHAFSFVDGISFCLMNQVGIQEAFAFDIHFSIAGFTRVGLDMRL